VVLLAKRAADGNPGKLMMTKASRLAQSQNKVDMAAVGWFQRINNVFTWSGNGFSNMVLDGFGVNCTFSSAMADMNYIVDLRQTFSEITINSGVDAGTPDNYEGYITIRQFDGMVSSTFGAYASPLAGHIASSATMRTTTSFRVPLESLFPDGNGNMLRHFLVVTKLNGLSP
jgi:uncharacterized metal-binding protein